MRLLNLVTVIVRSIGERTEGLCIQLIKEQGVSDEQIFLVNESPFSKAMRVSFERGITENREWTLCVDSDVLMRPGSIEHLIDIALAENENVFEIQGCLLDKFFGFARPCGVHLYRTKYLDLVITKIPKEGTVIRPEEYSLRKMFQDGYEWKNIPYVIGLHDFEQYNKDIYRKCFVHGFKHLKFLKLLLDTWRIKCDYDEDYSVALAAVSKSIMHKEGVSIDNRKKYFIESFVKDGFTEKKAIDLSDWSLEKVETIITNWEEPEEVKIEHPNWSGLLELGKTKMTFPEFWKYNETKRLGIVNKTIFLIGRILERSGKKLKRLASSGSAKRR